MAMDYKLSDKDRVGLAYTSQIIAGMNNNENSDGVFSQSANHKQEDKPIQMHHLLLDYSSPSGLKAGMEYTGYRDRTSQHFTEKKERKESDFIAKSRQEINQYRLFADNSHPIESWTLTYGAQYLYAADHSAQKYDGGTGQNNMDSKLKEYTANVYAGFQKSMGEKLSLSASLTGEYYRLADVGEWTIFPALEATYSISPSHIMQLSFSSDKAYPTYWELHGGISYLNGYAELHGNPLLKPYREYSGQLSYILKSKYILTAFYQYMKDYSAQLPYQAPDRLALIYQSLNFDYKQMAGLNLIIPFNIARPLESRLTLNGFYDKVKSAHFHDLSFKKDRLVFYSRLDNTINISSKPAIKLEITGAYITKNIQGPAELSPIWNVDAGIKWTFWRDMAELRLKGSDLFNTWMPDMTMKHSSQNLRMNMIPDSRSITVSLTLRLGDATPSDKKIDTSRFGTK
ncbi:MAG: outer membrane beta-barrel family protein [Tannerellaceae bacterium]|nr:outer membrane beta-barrel family protein [Tannerellaceae bacterium]